MYDIAFPHLGIFVEQISRGFSIFGFEIRYYGVIIGIAIIIATWIVSLDFERKGMNLDNLYDILIYGIIFGTIGARLYYVAFTWDMYKDDPIQILNIRNGGLAIYGCIIAAVITILIYTRVKKLDFLNVMDSISLGLLFGQGMGRWGNFFNCEAFGGYTDSLLAMRIRVPMANAGMITQELIDHLVTDGGAEYIQVHPTYLYESLWNLSLLAILLLYKKNRKFTGEVFLMYLAGYGIGRAWIEGLRTDSLLIPGTQLAVSQLLAGACAVTAVTLIVLGRNGILFREKKETETDDIQ